MQFLADENIPTLLVQSLRQQGHNVAWISEVAPQTADPEVLGQAQAESRVLLTLDKDFGELAFLRGLHAQIGIVLLRIPSERLREQIESLVFLFANHHDWEGNFTVIELDRIRVRKLPHTVADRKEDE